MATTDRDRVRRVNSRQNSLVKDLRRAFQHSELVEGHCAIEGVRVIEEAIRSGLRLKALFFADSAEPRMHKLLPQISSHVEVIALPDDVFSSAIATETPQGVAALVRWPEFSWKSLPDKPDLLLLGTVGVQDPGNLGTIIRSADAFGADAVLLGEKTVSEFNPKAVRASAGSSFRLPTIHVKLSKAEELKSRNVRIAVTSSHKGQPIHEVDLNGSIAVLIGSEGAGMSKEYIALADEFINVPHSPKVESLNAAIAASVILYEAQRQRTSQHRDTETQR
jgi:RNA methyltransferase, TrmH family